MTHSFHDCPLRVSSLIIINREKLIVTATDEVFNQLGYEPHQLIRKSIQYLNPQKYQNYYLLRNSNGQHAQFKVCIHCDPMNSHAGAGLEYWLIKPYQKLKATMFDSPISILKLSQFGTIEYAHPSKEFPQSKSELKGYPIMSYVHKLDLRSLCLKLKECKVYDSFKVRWLNMHPKYAQDEQEQDYIWVSFTVIHVPNNRPPYDLQTRPICIVRPVSLDKVENDRTGCSTISNDYLFSKFSITTLSSIISIIISNINEGTDYMNKFIEALNQAIDQGKTYLIEYFAHIITHLMNLIFDTITTTLNQDEDMHKSCSHDNINLVKVLLDNY